MKKIKFTLMVFMALAVCKSAMAFDPATDCAAQISENKLKEWKLSVPQGIQAIFGDYTNVKYSKLLSDGSYSLCFDINLPIQKNITTGFSITAVSSASLLIYGLNLAQTTGVASPMLQLSGQSITLDTVTLTGSGSGTAIQVDGADVSIKDSVISNFNIGISLASAGGAKLENNIFKSIQLSNVISPANFALLPFVADDGTVWVGKVTNSEDPTKADKVAGKLFLDASACAIFMDMYVDEETYHSRSVKYHSTCSASVLEEEKALKFGEDEEKTINVGECYFECVGSVSMNSVPAFVEKDASGYVTGYAAFSDLISYLPEVIFTGAPPITIFGTGGDMNGGTKIKLPELPNDGLGDDEKGPKIETVSLTGNDKRQTQSKTDNETVSQGASAGCGQMSIVDANSSSNMLQLLMSLLPLAGAPAIMIRRFKKKII